MITALNVNKPIYVNDETEEQAIERQKRINLNIKKGEIENLKAENKKHEESILMNNKRIIELENKLSKETQ